MSVESNRAPGGRSGQAMQLKLSLRGVSKPRLLVPADLRLDRLHEVIQTAIGWTNTHLHVFSTRSGDYGMPDPELGYRNERNAGARPAPPAALGSGLPGRKGRLPTRRLWRTLGATPI